MIYTDNGLDIELDQNTVDQLVEEILDASSQSIESVSKIPERQLKQAARNFISVLKYEQQNIRILELVLEEKKKWEKTFNKTSSLKGKALTDYRHKQIEYQNFTTKINSMKKDIMIQKSVANIYKAGLAFQDLMNKAIGQDPVIILQAVTTKKIASFEIPLKEAFSKKLLKVDISSDGKVTMRFRAPMGALEKYAASIDSEIQKIDNNRGMEDKSRLDAAYREVLRRFNKYKLKTPKNNVVSVVLWKKYQQWMKMLPSSRGDISEAYEEYYLTDLDGYMGNDLEENIDIFMSFVTNVDNARGRLLGDISKNNQDGTITEFAIKSAGASVETLDQIIDMAQSVINAADGMVKDTLQLMRSQDKDVAVRRNKIEILSRDELVYSVTKGVKTEINAWVKGFSP